MGFKKNIWAGLATLRCHKVSLAYSLLPPLCSIPPYPTLMVTITTTTTILLPNNTPQTIDENDKNNVAEVKLDFQVVALCPCLICYILLFMIVFIILIVKSQMLLSSQNLLPEKNTNSLHFENIPSWLSATIVSHQNFRLAMFCLSLCPVSLGFHLALLWLT